jgi:hypothetical protein
MIKRLAKEQLVPEKAIIPTFVTDASWASARIATTDRLKKLKM